MSYKIIDNILTDEELKNIQNVMFRNAFPWYFVSDAVPCNEDRFVKQYYIFCHYFLKAGCPFDDGEFGFPGTSHYIKILQPLIRKLGARALIRIQANYYPKADQVIEHGMHADFPFEENNATTAIFYLNTCNGYTKLDGDIKIASNANRLIVFPSDMLHTSSTCTDRPFRAVINFNYLL